MNVFEESRKLKQSMLPVLRQAIAKQTDDCLRIYKAKVSTAPNPNTGKCGVVLVGQTTVLNLPYATTVRSVAVGDMVWVAISYNSWRNAVVLATINFTDSNDIGQTYQAFGKISNAYEIYGNVNYTRTGVKKGLLTINATFPQITSENDYQYIDLSLIFSLLNGQVSLKTPTQKVTGYWVSSSTITDANLLGFATCCFVDNTNIHAGRYYTTAGDYGSWQANLLSGLNITLSNIEIEEE